MGSQGQFKSLAIILYFNCLFHCMALSTPIQIFPRAIALLSTGKEERKQLQWDGWSRIFPKGQKTISLCMMWRKERAQGKNYRRVSNPSCFNTHLNCPTHFTDEETETHRVDGAYVYHLIVCISIFMLLETRLIHQHIRRTYTGLRRVGEMV